jgi:hypothetical protein
MLKAKALLMLAMISLISVPASSLTVDFAIVEGFIVEPWQPDESTYGLRVTPGPVVEVPLDQCVSEAQRMKDELQAAEVAQAAAIGLAPYTPGSNARCITKTKTFVIKSKISVLEPLVCEVVWEAGMDYVLAFDNCTP